MSGSEPETDVQLIARARDGDTAAFRILVERHEGRVAATVIGMLGPGADADDVGQEVFVRFYRALGDFRGDAALGTYLTRIAINLSLNALKRRQRYRERFVSAERPPLEPGGAPRPEEPPDAAPDAIVRSGLADAVQDAIATLPDEQRAVVLLRLVQGHSTREAADLLQIPEGTVTSRLTRARATLQDLLEPFAEDYR